MASSGCLVVEKVEDHGVGGDAARGNGRARVGCGGGSCPSAGAAPPRSETMFPIYVMGSARAAPPRAVLDPAAGDPIWEAVKAEARSEVRETTLHSITPAPRID